jgi:hypothetical protein
VGLDVPTILVEDRGEDPVPVTDMVLQRFVFSCAANRRSAAATMSCRVSGDAAIRVDARA